MRRSVALLALALALGAWVVPAILAMPRHAEHDGAACENPHCVCPVPQDGVRCDCACCSRDGDHGGALPAMCGTCRPGDTAAAVAPLPRVVPPTELLLPAPDGRSAAPSMNPEAPESAPAKTSDPVPRPRG